MDAEAEREVEFSKLQKATISLNFLRSNSTTHENPLSAIAELCDNAYDANASSLRIDFMEKDGEETLRFLDDGTGMSHQEAVSVISFGHSVKNCDKIGRYGNGLKSGGFHLGTELLMLTKKDGIQTALFISHRFHEEKGLSNAVFVPCPAFKLDMEPVFSDEGSRDRFDQEMDIIEAYAPLGGRALQELFDEITGDSGTHIIISGLKRSVVGGLSIIVTNDDHDIQLEGENLMPYQKSLREYLKILYLKPKMRIVLRGEQVFPKKLTENWIARKRFPIRNDKFTDACKDALAAVDNEIKGLNNEKRVIETQIGEMNTGGMGINTKADAKLAKIINQIDEAQKRKKAKEASIKNDKSIFYMYFGIETKDRSNNGIHFYMNNRLIIFGYKAKSTFFKSQPKEHTIGVSVYANLSYEVFHPTHNKQSFSSARDFNTLVKNCDQRLTQYSEYIEKNWIVTHLEKQWDRRIQSNENPWEALWQKYGYRNAFSLNCQQTKFDEEQQKIFEKECGVWRLCLLCRNWRRVRSLEELNGTDPKTFQCKNIIVEKGCSSVNHEHDGGFRTFDEAWAEKPTARSTSFRHSLDTRDIPSASSPSTAAPTASHVIRSTAQAKRNDDQLASIQNSFSPDRSSRMTTRNNATPSINIKRDPTEDPPELSTEVDRTVQQPAPAVNLPRIAFPARIESPERADPLLSPPSTRRTATPSTNGRRAVMAEDRIVQQPIPSVNLPRIASPARPDPSPNTRQRARIAPNDPRVAMMHSDDDESGNEHQGATSSAQRSRREVARKPAEKVSRRRELPDQEDDVEEEPIVKKIQKVKKPTNLHVGMRPSGSSRPPIISKDEELAELLRQRGQWTSHIQRLEDVKEQYDHKVGCVLDTLKKKHSLKVPVTGTPFNKLSAVYEDIVPRSVRNAKK